MPTSSPPGALSDLTDEAPSGLDDDDELDDENTDITALAEAVREAGRVTTGLVETGQDPIEYSADKDFNNPDTSNHPVHRTKRVEEQIAAAKAARRSHLRIVPDPEVEQ